MDQEKETKRQAERCRALAQRIVRELTPASIQVLGGSGALAEELEKTGAQLLPENAELGTAALLVVEDPEWVDLPALQCAQVLLVCTDASAMADCAKQLAAQPVPLVSSGKLQRNARKTFSNHAGFGIL